MNDINKKEIFAGIFFDFIGTSFSPKEDKEAFLDFINNYTSYIHKKSLISQDIRHIEKFIAEHLEENHTLTFKLNYDGEDHRYYPKFINEDKSKFSMYYTFARLDLNIFEGSVGYYFENKKIELQKNNFKNALNIIFTPQEIEVFNLIENYEVNILKKNIINKNTDRKNIKKI